MSTTPDLSTMSAEAPELTREQQTEMKLDFSFIESYSQNIGYMNCLSDVLDLFDDNAEARKRIYTLIPKF